ncbi:MAG: hypothetical protein IJU10_03305 [Clostridia bacterium]|nr:hypothetical protein [Clostridia bacterium]
MKKLTVLIIAILLALSVVFAACGSTDTDTGSDAAASQSYVAIDSVDIDATVAATDDYLMETAATVTEEQTVTSSEEEVVINLSELTKDNAPEGTKYKDDVLTITAAGTYRLTGTLNGAVEVKRTSRAACISSSTTPRSIPSRRRLAPHSYSKKRRRPASSRSRTAP